MTESKRALNIMTSEAWKKRRKGKEKGRHEERREKNHVRDTPIAVIWIKRTNQQKQQKGNQDIIIKKLRKGAKNEAQKGKAVHHCEYSVFARWTFGFYDELVEHIPQNLGNRPLSCEQAVQLFPQGGHGLERTKERRIKRTNRPIYASSPIYFLENLIWTHI